MSASLLPSDSAAAHRSRELLAAYPRLSDMPGLPQARMLIDYVIGRRCGVLDVSGRDTEGTFVAAELSAEVPENLILVDDGHGLQATLLSRLTQVCTYNDRLDEARASAAAVESSAGAGDSAGVAGELGTEAAPVLAVSELREIAELAELAVGETWAVVNAPKALNALTETIAVLQPFVSTIIVIGRSDAMSRGVNKELARGFGRVDVSPGVGKHRMIIGSRPLSSPSLPEFPRRGVISHGGVGELEVRAHGACFSGTKSDEGSELLIDSLLGLLPGEALESVLDLGCGNGWLLTVAMRASGANTGFGVDVSKAAVTSARATAEANGVDVDIILGDAADREEPALAGLGGFDLVLLNPPFHQGTTIETETAAALMATAAEHLAPGGQVLTVFNSHLRYRDRLESIIGPSQQLARNKKFTVIASRRP
ncbi:16S rRNA (guanine1207-N2)-methyltransferase [Brevibacterium iodinum ATCC 49514]|uniref:16S rRNA (Guanine1207-N2)-methyltransferase n=1 Tax=Brevibacterium iodinum ATCC 49514 TaxID=1255616 RepID=A0A2H1JY40_9MICO|nr:methyltransferase [Brevibacterium iodinum]SMX92391.1 16S rRNA (guanine1207-N2)-methyltransferase [Brevibacterium iodinum ATCC 49514]SUW13207.1 Ribosomal RNA small subunit methyltransferase C [Brevibacterium iodinum]